MRIQYRFATLNDISSILNLTHQLGYTPEQNVMQEVLEHVINSKTEAVFVATIDNTPIGWIHIFKTCRIETGFFVEIGGLVVDSDFRKKGIAKQLIALAEKWTLEQNCNKLRVRCNALRNETHQFYAHTGFTLKKEQKIYDKPLS